MKGAWEGRGAASRPSPGHCLWECQIFLGGNSESTLFPPIFPEAHGKQGLRVSRWPSAGLRLVPGLPSLVCGPSHLGNKPKAETEFLRSFSRSPGPPRRPTHPLEPHLLGLCPLSETLQVAVSGEGSLTGSVTMVPGSR